jgi:hypothetical protein
MKNLVRASCLLLTFALTACGNGDPKNDASTAGDGGTADRAGGSGGGGTGGGGTGGGGGGTGGGAAGRDGGGGTGGTTDGGSMDVPMGTEGGMAGSDGGPTPGTGSAAIGPGGGTVSSADGRVTLVVPPGALEATVTISIQRQAMAVMGALGGAYDITPHATRFSMERRARLTFRPPAGDLGGADIAAVRVALQTPGTSWLELEEPVTDAAAGSVRGLTGELGLFGLIAGLCTACPAACDPATCRFGAMAGQCVSVAGCSVCRPSCDTDQDGFCPGGGSGDVPGGDCNDGNARINPEAREICGNEVDENCNAHTSEGCRTCTADSDCPQGLEACVEGVCQVCDHGCDATNCRFGMRDGMPMSGVAGRCVDFGRGCNRCVPACDMDGDGFCPAAMPGNDQPGGDCNDNNPNVNTGRAEICGNSVDDDCDGKVDENCVACTNDSACGMGTQCKGAFCEPCPSPACDMATCRIGGMAGMPMTGTPGRCAMQGNGCSVCVPTCDTDGDGFCPGGGSGDNPGGDCNDTNRSIHPEAVEVCGNTVDENCNNHTDEGCKACSRDSECTAGLTACIAGRCSLCDATCDASNCRFGVMDGMPMSGVPGRCIDQGTGCKRCVPGCDMDGDGFCPQMMPGNDQPGGDCNDSDAAAHPGAREICGNMVDEDCNGRPDDKCTTCQMAMGTCGAMQSCSSGR